MSSFCANCEPMKVARLYLRVSTDGQDLQRRDEAVAGGAVIAEDQVAALFAAKVVATFEHFIDDIFIAHRRADDLSSSGLDGAVEAGIAHHCGDEGVVGKRTLGEHFQRGNGHYVVAVNKGAIFVAEQHAVGIAIVGYTDVGVVFLYPMAHLLGVHGAAAGVDVSAVGTVAVNNDVRAQLA